MKLERITLNRTVLLPWLGERIGRGRFSAKDAAIIVHPNGWVELADHSGAHPSVAVPPGAVESAELPLDTQLAADRETVEIAMRELERRLTAERS